jgi:hypothetical protein
LPNSFANFGSLGIQIGVLSGLAPSRAKIIAVIAPSALIFGFLSTCQVRLLSLSASLLRPLRSSTDIVSPAPQTATIAGMMV